MLASQHGREHPLLVVVHADHLQAGLGQLSTGGGLIPVAHPAHRHHILEEQALLLQVGPRVGLPVIGRGDETDDEHPLWPQGLGHLAVKGCADLVVVDVDVQTALLVIRSQCPWQPSCQASRFSHAMATVV